MGRVRRAIDIARRIFGSNHVLVYTDAYFNQFSDLEDDRIVPLDDYIAAMGEDDAAAEMAGGYGLIPGGRAAIRLARLYTHYPASQFFNETCEKELSSPHHIHIDPEGNYIAGLCAGISLGNGRDLDSLYAGIDLEPRPLLKCLVNGGVEQLLQWAQQEADYQESSLGYIAKCHLCLDIRRHLIRQKINLRELAPKAFYTHLDV